MPVAIASGFSESAADQRALIRILVHGAADPSRPLCHSLGLAPDALGALIGRFPALAPLVPAGREGCDAGSDTPEEPDLRSLLLDHATRPGPPRETRWLATIVARACQGRHHLWQDLGLDNRTQLSDLMWRHFAPLAQANSRDMKWKKFFYRCLCDREGISFCPAPRCDDCPDQRNCFSPEV